MSGWGDAAPPLPDDEERCWQEQLLRWRYEYEAMLAMARAGHVDLTRLRMGLESFELDPVDKDAADAHRDQEDWWHDRWCDGGW